MTTTQPEIQIMVSNMKKNNFNAKTNNEEWKSKLKLIEQMANDAAEQFDTDFLLGRISANDAMDVEGNNEVMEWIKSAPDNVRQAMRDTVESKCYDVLLSFVEGEYEYD